MDLYPSSQGDLKFQMRVGLRDEELLLENIDIAAEDYARLIRNLILKRLVEVSP
ncbi:hypothetical protein P879_03537 [Paragonimus westermani]|uniref:Uncharacterized protein n=1 Tax=Paragonimus westermani TaxID=34504 RepID=A0A8T0DZK9_9TREM|nr:hypothetical protein P879_03537 [Paragonimus westermani]